MSSSRASAEASSTGTLAGLALACAVWNIFCMRARAPGTGSAAALRLAPAAPAGEGGQPNAGWSWATWHGRMC